MSRPSCSSSERTLGRTSAPRSEPVWHACWCSDSASVLTSYVMKETPSSGKGRGTELDRLDFVDRVLAFLSRFVALDETDRQLIRKLTRIEHYPKGTVLLAEGDVARETWLVIEGCVRAFHRTHGDDQTLAFYTEFHPAIPPTYGNDTPSPLTLECLEDVVAS